MTSTEAPTAPTNRQGLLLGGLLFVLAGLLFLPSLSGEFVYDDLLLVANNPRLDGFGSILDAFTRSYWEGYDAESAGEVGYWRPLSTVALVLGKMIGGGNPQGFHIVSVVTHALCSLVLFLLVRRLTKNDTIAFFSALLFAWHPLHVESVAWISGIGDLVAGFFIIAMLERWLSWRERGSPGIPLVPAVLFLCGLLSKEAAIAGLPLLVVVDWMRPDKKAPAGASGRAIATMSMAFALYVLTRMAVFGSVTAGLDQTVTDFGVSFGRLLLLRLELFGGYVELIAWPSDLNLFRPFRPVLPMSAMLGPIVATALYVMVLFILQRRKLRQAVGAWLFIPAALLPALLFVDSLGTFPLSDRYAYLAIFGLTTALCILAFRSLAVVPAGALLALAAGGYAWQSLERIPFWESEETLFEEAVAQNPKSPYARWGFGRVLLARFQEHGNKDDLKLAREQYDEAMNLLEAARESDFEIFATKKDHLESNLGLGWALLYEAENDPFRDFNTPLRQFERTAEYAPGSSNALVGQGVALFLAGLHDRAAAKIREALAINPGSAAAHVAMGRILFHLGDSERAAEKFEEALALRPGHLSTMLLYVGAIEATMDETNANQVLQQMEKVLSDARALHPEAGEPLRMMGVVAMNRQNPAEALRLFNQAIELSPDDAFLHQLKGQVLALIGENKEALRSLMKSADLDVNNFTARFNIATLLAESSDPESAIPYLIHAYALRPTVPDPSTQDPKGDGIRAKLLELAPNDALVCWKMAEIDLSRDKPYRDQARQWTALAIQTDPEFSPAYVLRARMRLEDSETDEEVTAAFDDYKRAIELSPEYFDALYELGIALMERGRGPEALPYLKAAVEFIGNSTMTQEQMQDIEPALRARVMTLERN